ncbi:hypothetical protein BG011_002845 [Mortierella polycephala]|uniref:Uncharacterized protein n=1 Tax=Mortierella polycephala TaxID=41804 RepID=A0A9P6Q4A9_9FUNG|nr:hypothetical protein BG011_002845 [Mortierella polycephala]
MIPTKRSSPFARARSFQNSQTRNGQDSHGSESTPPFAKKPAFARSRSSPFQVLSPSLKTAKNPFEKLAPATFTSDLDISSAAVKYAQLKGEEEEGGEGEEEEEEEDQDEALDPSKTLQMFSFSQTVASRVSVSALDEELPEDEEEHEQHQEAEQDSKDGDMDSILDIQPIQSRKPRLHEALEMSLNLNRSRTTQEFQAPAPSNIAPKKLGTEWKTAGTLPLDWTLKTSIIITSRDTLVWCDQSSTLDDIEALQQFVSAYASSARSHSHSRGANINQYTPLSPRTRLLATLYHWCYPTNSPTIPQAQNISRLLKNAGNMTSADKNSISDLFSRVAEWKQAFMSIYRSCRNGACPYFYYVGTAWTILFQHGSVSKSGSLEATLTNSTPGLRKVLDDEGGKTTVRNFSSKHDLQGFDDKESETRLETTTKSPFQIESKPELSDTLLFQGQVDVHGLFSYLLTLKASYEDGFLYNSPSLIAGVPFLHAALKCAQLSKHKVVSKHIEGTDTLQKEFRIELDGVILPTLFKELCNVFAKQQSVAGYTCVASSDSRSHGLNLRPLLRNPNNDEDTSDANFVSPRALDNVRYNPNEQRFTWLS